MLLRHCHEVQESKQHCSAVYDCWWTSCEHKGQKPTIKFKIFNFFFALSLLLSFITVWLIVNVVLIEKKKMARLNLFEANKILRPVYFYEVPLKRSRPGRQFLAGSKQLQGNSGSERLYSIRIGKCCAYWHTTSSVQAQWILKHQLIRDFRGYLV